MSRTKQDVQEAIEQLDLSAEQKAEMLKQLDQRGVTEELLTEIKDCLDRMEDEIFEEEAAMTEVEAAQVEFNLEMDQIDKESREIEKRAGAELDQIEIDDLRKQLGE